MNKYSFNIQVPAIGDPNAIPKVLFTCTFTANTFGDANHLAAKLEPTCMEYVRGVFPRERVYERSRIVMVTENVRMTREKTIRLTPNDWLYPMSEDGIKSEPINKDAQSFIISSQDIGTATIILRTHIRGSGPRPDREVTGENINEPIEISPAVAESGFYQFLLHENSRDRIVTLKVKCTLNQ